jgi:hypothetical protein
LNIFVEAESWICDSGNGLTVLIHIHKTEDSKLTRY